MECLPLDCEDISSRFAKLLVFHRRGIDSVRHLIVSVFFSLARFFIARALSDWLLLILCRHVAFAVEMPSRSPSVLEIVGDL